MSAGAALVIGLAFVLLVVVLIREETWTKRDVFLTAVAAGLLLGTLALNLWGQR